MAAHLPSARTAVWRSVGRLASDGTLCDWPASPHRDPGNVFAASCRFCNRASFRLRGRAGEDSLVGPFVTPSPVPGDASPGMPFADSPTTYITSATALLA